MSVAESVSRLSSVRLERSKAEIAALSYGTAAQIEQALFVNLVYRQVADGTQAPFVAVDCEPSLNLQPQVLWISEFTDYQPPQSAACQPIAPPVSPNTGGGKFFAADLRNAYLGVNSFCQTQNPPLDGSGQTVGILALEPFNPTDVTGYIAAQATGITSG